MREEFDGNLMPDDNARMKSERLQTALPIIC
jgi:hypothetical protein